MVDVFRDSAITPHALPEQSLSEAIEPAFVSETAGHEATVHEFERGMDALGFKEIHPQQRAIQHVADSVREDGRPSYRFVSVNEPRRSGKSESTYAVLLGRCLERPGYRVALTFATTGTKAAQRFKTDIFDRLEAWADITGTDLTCIRSNGHEGIKFGNGSSLQILPPKGEAFRSEAFDVVLVDEAGEASKAMTGILLESILPTMDTRPGAQLIVAGTPPEFREGNLLYDRQTRAMQGKNRYGAVFYGVPHELTLEDIETWELTAPLVEAHHPGVGTLTELEDLEANYDDMGPASFAREYLGQAGRDEATPGVINAAKWRDCAVPADTEMPTLPPYFAVGFAVAWDQSASAITAAWRDADGKALVVVLAYQSGTAWLPEKVNEVAERYRRVPIGYDAVGQTTAEADKTEQARARTRLTRIPWAQVQSAAALFVREVHQGNLLHWDQESLTSAALSASRRGNARGFAFGRPSNTVQIAALEAAAIALQLFDSKPRVANQIGKVA